MTFQRVLLKDAEVIADAATSYTCDLPRSAFIAAVILRLYGTGGSGTVVSDDIITGINVRASAPSETYYDMDSDEMRLRAKQLCSIAPSVTNATGAATEVNLMLLFGRKIKDKRLMLDAAKHGALQLTLNFGTLIATTVFATTTVRLDIELIIWTGSKPGEYVGCIKSTHWKALVTGTGWANIELPQGNAFDTVSFLVGTITTIDEIIFGINNKQETPFNSKMQNLIEQNVLEFEWATAETVQAIIDFCLEGAGREGDLNSAVPAPKESTFTLHIDRGATTSTLEVFVFEIVR